ncbi:MAG: hypothetical protein AAFO79_01090 [Pseudomonadota bacterium]
MRGTVILSKTETAVLGLDPVARANDLKRAQMRTAARRQLPV